MSYNPAEQQLFDKLFALNGKLTRREFAAIKRHYGWTFAFQKVHIVGTNGKGTMAHSLHNELMLHHQRVGMFTSPHLLDPRERIVINGRNIDLEQIIKYTTDLQVQFPEIQFGFFDLLFLSALRWFETAQVDIAIFEAGIGAKRDIVNFVKHEITIITTISLDHQALLGSTVQQIARDKAHAIKAGGIVYLPSGLAKELIALFQRRALKVGAQLHILQLARRTHFALANELYVAAILRQGFGIYELKGRFCLPPGRLHHVQINGHYCLIDGAHNVEGVAAVLRFLKVTKTPIAQVVVSLSKDKEQELILQTLQAAYPRLLIYENRGRKPLLQRDYSPQYYCKAIRNLDLWLEQLDRPTLFIGSFYLAAEILRRLK